MVIKITVYSTHLHASADQTAEVPTNDQKGWGARHCRLRGGWGGGLFPLYRPAALLVSLCFFSFYVKQTKHTQFYALEIRMCIVTVV